MKKKKRRLDTIHEPPPKRRNRSKKPDGVDICPNCHEIVTLDANGNWACDNCGARSGRSGKSLPF